MRFTSILAVLVFVISPGLLRAQDAETVYRPGPGIVNPVVVRSVKPNYTPEAMRQKIQGTVMMEVVVRKDGTVGDLRVTRSLDATYGLDAEAIAAAKQWAFKPAMRRASPDAEYEPVNVYVTLQLMFRLNDNRAYFPGTPGLVAPVLLSELKVAYTAEARQHHIEGDVIVEARVEADGHIGAAEIAKSLDKAYGLDDAALAAVRALMFTPATLDGSPVAAFTSIDVAFKLE